MQTLQRAPATMASRSSSSCRPPVVAAAGRGGGAVPQPVPQPPPRRADAAIAPKPVRASSSSSSSAASMPAAPAVAAAGSQIRYRVKQQPVPAPLAGAGPGAKAGSGPGAGRPTGSAAAGGLDFVTKLKMAWRIFFPERPTVVSPKEEGKQRLRMILVADRCGMSPAGLTDLKRTILNALGEYVDIDSEEQIDVSITMEPGLGTIYCVAVPVARVRPAARVKLAADGTLAGMTVVGGSGGGGEEPEQQQRPGGEGREGRRAGGGAKEGDEDYNPEDWDSDPSSQFPYGC